MPSFDKDPIGLAIQDFVAQQHDENIVVKSSICEDDVIPVAYLFRGDKSSSFEFTEIEQCALSNCEGKILEIGAGAGIHALHLKNQGFDIQVIDTSAGAVEHHKSLSLPTRQINFFELENEQYDTLLFLMNGLGIAGKLDNLSRFLQKCRDLLPEQGTIIADSTDIKYLYEDDEGGYWMDLNSAYYGDFDFQMCYKNTCTDVFDWLYVDFNTLKKHAEQNGFSIELLFEMEQQYLVKMRKMN